MKFPSCCPMPRGWHSDNCPMQIAMRTAAAEFLSGVYDPEGFALQIKNLIEEAYELER